MKKQFLLLAGAAIMFASCGSNNEENKGQTQAQVDSAVNAKLAEHDAANAAKNDSTLKAIEAEKAAAAAATAKETETKTTSTTKTSGGKTKTKTKTETKTVEPTPPPPPAGGMRGHADNATPAAGTGAKQGGGMRSHADGK